MRKVYFTPFEWIKPHPMYVTVTPNREEADEVVEEVHNERDADVVMFKTHFDFMSERKLYIQLRSRPS
jgi:hypothetical protein